MTDKSNEAHVQNLTMIAAALSLAYMDALRRLSAFHGGASGPWLDEIEAGAIEMVKSADHETPISMEAEVAAMDAAIRTMRELVKNVRGQLEV